MANDLKPIADRLRHVAAISHVTPEDLTLLVGDTFMRCGLPREDAGMAAEIAVWAQLHGSDSHGVVHLPLYVRGLLDRTINGRPNITTDHAMSCCAVMDADRALGLVASLRATNLAIDFAKTYGLGAVAVRNSSHFGVAGYYANRAAEQGLIGLSFTNAMPAIAPTGGTEALFGTNPIGVAFPVPGADPIIADMATAAVARSRIRHVLAAGCTTIPEGWALDPEGRPTTDANLALKGSIQPIGGPKGYALSLMVEALCSALSDGQPGFEVTYENMAKRPSGICQFFLVLNPQGFAGSERYGARMGHIADVVSKAKGIEGAAAPRMPGARGHAVACKAKAEGIALFLNLRNALKSVADTIEKEMPAP
jgi:LDH2 family malate/lactate/ureidoglycolate dehydrogenase